MAKLKCPIIACVFLCQFSAFVYCSMETFRFMKVTTHEITGGNEVKRFRATNPRMCTIVCAQTVACKATRFTNGLCVIGKSYNKTSANGNQPIFVKRHEFRDKAYELICGFYSKDTARTKCGEIGGKLAIPRRRDELQFLFKMKKSCAATVTATDWKSSVAWVDLENPQGKELRTPSGQILNFSTNGLWERNVFDSEEAVVISSSIIDLLYKQKFVFNALCQWKN